MDDYEFLIDLNDSNIDYFKLYLNSYFKHVDFLKVARCYINVELLMEEGIWGYFPEYSDEVLDDGFIFNEYHNSCTCFGKEINVIEFMRIFEGNLDVCKAYDIIKRITGVDINDYIAEVHYKNGKTIYQYLEDDSNVVTIYK